jgi:uncharacterized protein (TIGR03086 family)
MSENAQRYQRVSDGFSTRLSGVPAEQWTTSTPCSEWTVRELVAHVISTQHHVVASLDGGKALAVDADGDLVGQWSDARAALVAAVNDPARAGTTVKGLFSEQPFETLVGGLACLDTLIHTWDLARATGQDESLDPEAVDNGAQLLASFGDGIRRPGGFGAEVPSAPDVDAQTRLLQFAGRSV